MLTCLKSSDQPRGARSRRGRVLLAFIAVLIGCDQNAIKSDVRAKSKCADIGLKWAQQHQSSLRQPGVMLMRPEYAYNRRLDTCLCMLGSWDNSNGGSTREC